MTIGALFTAAAAALALLVAAPAIACTQETADRLSARTDAEWAREVMRDHPVAGLYVLGQVSGEVYQFDLVTSLSGAAPTAFQTGSFLVIGCAHSADWWAEERTVGEQVVVTGDLSASNSFKPELLYGPGTPQGAALLALMAPTAGPACPQDMAPFCVNTRYLPALTLDYGYAGHLPGEMKSDPVAADALGVDITRAFPHFGIPDRPRPYLRPVCRDGACIDLNASCRPDGLQCVWSQDFGTRRGSGFLSVEARSQAAMGAAKANLWFIVNGVRVPLTDPDVAPVMRDR